MGYELIVALLSILVISLPAIAWIILRKISTEDRLQNSSEELHALENSLSLMIKELQNSVDKALTDMEEAAEKLNKMIEAADDRIRQLEYYYEYGDELRPLIPTQPTTQQPIQQQDNNLSAKQTHALRHREVHELSKKGWSASQIAKHTGMSTDEVQLIINLMEISSFGTSQSASSNQPLV